MSIVHFGVKSGKEEESPNPSTRLSSIRKKTAVRGGLARTQSAAHGGLAPALSYGGLAPTPSAEYGRLTGMDPLPSTDYGGFAAAPSNNYGGLAPAPSAGFGDLAAAPSSNYGGLAPAPSAGFGDLAAAPSSNYGGLAPAPSAGFGNLAAAPSSNYGGLTGLDPLPSAPRYDGPPPSPWDEERDSFESRYKMAKFWAGNNRDLGITPEDYMEGQKRAEDDESSRTPPGGLMRAISMRTIIYFAEQARDERLERAGLNNPWKN